MKNKKQESKQILEVHIYIHQQPPQYVPPVQMPSGTGFPPPIPPYIVTCGI